MATEQIECSARPRRNEPRTFEVFGRVMTLLGSHPGPLAHALALESWPMLTRGGFVLTWRGLPTGEEVMTYMLDVAADDEATTVLRPGDVEIADGRGYLTVSVRGVLIQLRPEPMPSPQEYEAMGQYWRTGRYPVGD